MIAQSARKVLAAPALAATLVAGLAAGFWSPAVAAAESDYAAFNTDVETLKDRMLSWCEANREDLDLGTQSGALTEEERFRKACGRALDGRVVPGTEGTRLFHFRQGNNVAGMEYFGIRRALDFRGDPYVLVTAWLIRTTTEVGQERKTSQTADAFLMGVHNGAWRTAWRYVDFEEGSWRRPASEKLGAEILSKDLEAFIDRVWKEQVVEGTAQLSQRVASGEARLIAPAE